MGNSRASSVVNTYLQHWDMDNRQLAGPYGQDRYRHQAAARWLICGARPAVPHRTGNRWRYPEARGESGTGPRSRFQSPRKK